MEAEKASVERRFLGLPSLGGMLAIANCLSFVGIELLLQSGFFRRGGGGEDFLACVMLFLSLPLALPFLLPSLGVPTEIEQMTNGIVIGINSFIWGYGLAWVWSKLVRRRRTPNADTNQPTMN